MRARLIVDFEELRFKGENSNMPVFGKNLGRFSPISLRPAANCKLASKLELFTGETPN